MSYKGTFKPRNPEKYKPGQAGNFPVYRSLWEWKLCKYCDSNKNIVEWSVEPFAIPYTSPLDNRTHRYFPDFYIKTSNGDIFIVEVKPDNQTRKPKYKKTPKRGVPTKRFLREQKTYAVNLAKWDAAAKFCKNIGAEFKIMTEKNANF
jgi:hypothetical protein